MFCEKCGKKVESNWQFCKFCGNPLEEVLSGEEDEISEKEIPADSFDSGVNEDSAFEEKLSEEDSDIVSDDDLLTAKTIVIPEEVRRLISDETEEYAEDGEVREKNNKNGGNNKKTVSKKDFFKKNMKWIIPAVVVLLAALVVLIVFLSTRPEKTSLNLSDYINVKVDGYDGSGNVLSFFEADRVFGTVLGPAPDEKDLSEEGIKKYYDYTAKYAELSGALKFDLSFADEKTSAGLSNGDKVVVTVTSNLEVFAKYGYVIESPVVIKEFIIGTDTRSLGGFSELGILDCIEVSFSGFNGDGKVVSSSNTKTLNFPSDNIKQIDITSDIKYSGGDDVKITVNMTVTAVKFGGDGNLTETTFDKKISLSSTASSGLSNGDKFKISADKDDLLFLEAYGVKIGAYEKSFVVEGLQDPVQIDLLRELDVSFSGDNGFGKASVLPEEKTVSLPRSLFGASEIKVKITAKSVNEYFMSLAVPDSENPGNIKTVSINLPVSNYENLSNGDVFTVSVWLEDKDMLEALGIILSSSNREIPVSGLSDFVEDEE